MAEFTAGETVVISTVDPIARVLMKRSWPCRDCGGAVWHCELVETGEHVDFCALILRRRN